MSKIESLVLQYVTLDDPRGIRLRQPEILNEFYHRNTRDDLIEIGCDLGKLRRGNDARMLDALDLFQQPMMQAVQHTHDRDYPMHPCIRLPEPGIPARPLREALCARRSVRSFSGASLGVSALGSLLFGAIGETGRLITSFEDGRPIEASLRAIPSAGALHPTGIFIVIVQDGELAKGIYHYDVPEHSLEFVRPLSDREFDALFAAFPIHPQVVDITQAAAIFFISSKFWRARAKYGPRGYRYCVLEAGCACQNLGLTAVALGLGHVVIGGFYDDEIHSCLDIDGVDHAVITAMAIGAMRDEHAEGSNHGEL
jgi:SagB-type dehydrogenase family enzyme